MSRKKYCLKSIGIVNTSATVSVLVLAIVFGQSIDIGIANTFHKYC